MLSPNAPPSKNLVVTADDAGLTVGLNRGIEQLVDAGRLKNVSLMVNSPAAEDAVERLRRFDDLSLGLHFNVYQDAPLSRDVGGLAPLLGPDGGFLRSLSGTVRAFRGAPGLADAVRRELDAQLDRFAAFGLTPSHIDIHKFLAGTPVWRITADCAAERGLPYRRGPVEPASLLMRTTRWPLKGWATAMAISGWTRVSCKPPAGVRTMPCAGIACIGEWTTHRMASVLENTAGPALEIVMHPGEHCDDLGHNHTRLLHQREDEMELLLSDRFGALLEEHGWRIAGYRDCA